MSDPIYSTEELRRIQDAFTDIQQWLHLKLRTGRYSFGFALELVHHQLNRIYDVFDIYREIEYLEHPGQKRSNTKKASKFGKGPLKGLWHKHHSQAGFIINNITAELNRPGVMEKICEPYFGKSISEISDMLSYDMVMGTYKKRNERRAITGEWIIFEKQTERNYYLTLASHKEDYELIRSRIERNREIDIHLKTTRGIDTLC